MNLPMIPKALYYNNIVNEKNQREAGKMWDRVLTNLASGQPLFPIVICLGEIICRKFYKSSDAVVEILRDKIHMEMKNNCGYFFVISKDEEEEDLLLKCFPDTPDYCKKCGIKKTTEDCCAK